MNRKKIFNIVVECLWVAMSLFCLSVGIYYQVKFDSVPNLWIFYAMAVISAGMFVLRFMQRRNEEKRAQRREVDFRKDIEK